MRVIYLDIETDNSNKKGLIVHETKIVTIQLLFDDCRYLFLKDPTYEEVQKLKPILENCLIVGHNIAFDSKFLQYHFGIKLNHLYDTMIAEQVLSGGLLASGYKPKRPWNLRIKDEDDAKTKATKNAIWKKKLDARLGVSLADVVKRRLGIEIDKSEQKGFVFGQPLTEAQKQYMINDVIHLPAIMRQQQREARQAGLEQTIKIEMEAIPAVVWLSLSGVHIDQNVLAEISKLMLEEHQKLEKQAREALRGYTDNLISPHKLKAWLNEMGIPVTKTSKGELSKFSDLPAVKAILEFKKSNTLVTRYVKKTAKFVSPITGRIHASFSQVGTLTGRFSCSKPNLQQQPSRFKVWRRIYTAESGNILVIADLSQIELRILGMLAKEPVFIKAYNPEPGEAEIDLHAKTASSLLNISYEKALTNPDNSRTKAKTINFGLSYGMTSTGLAVKLKTDYEIEITTNEAQELINNFWITYPRIKQYVDRISQQAIKTRVLRNKAGRMIRIDFNATNGEAAREGMNVPVQSLCGDIVKIAMTNLYYLLEPREVKLINTVHDELVFECPASQAEEIAIIVKSEMEKVGNLFLEGIPCIADVSISNSWINE